MKKFEDNIRKNREVFNDAEPPAGHFGRFAKKLEEAEGRAGKPLILQIGFLWRVAAAILILIAVSVLYNQIDNLPLASKGHGQSLPPEIQEAVSYYSQLNHEKLKTISQFAEEEHVSDEVVKTARLETEAINQNSEELKEQYIQTRDDRVIDAIITNYRVLSSLLDHIIHHIEKTR